MSLLMSATITATALFFLYRVRAWLFVLHAHRAAKFLEANPIHCECDNGGCLFSLYRARIDNRRQAILDLTRWTYRGFFPEFR